MIYTGSFEYELAVGATQFVSERKFEKEEMIKR